MKKIVLCGPPKAGKSCLREGLKQALMVLNRQGKSPYPYFITGCPDGEGAWFQEAVNHDPELAKRCKDAYKAKFTPEFVQRVADSVRNCSLPLTLVDIGGVPSAENENICSSATDCVLLMPKSMRKDKFEDLQGRYRALGLGVPETLEDVRLSWHRFAKKLGLTVAVELCSDYAGQEDAVPILGTDGVYRGSVHHLERGEPVGERPTIKRLAEILVGMVSDEK